MTLSMLNQIIQFSAWLIALTELILGCYTLIINFTQAANRSASILLLSAAIGTGAIGWMVGAAGTSQILPSALALAMFMPAIPLFFFVTMLAILKPEWRRGGRRWIAWLIYLLAIIPAAVTIYDFSLRTSFWFSGIPAEASKGYPALTAYTSGAYAFAGHLLAFAVIPLISMSFLGYFTFLDRRTSPNNRRLAWLLLSVQAGTLVLFWFPASIVYVPVAQVGSIALLAIPGGYATLHQMMTERRAQGGSLQARLTALIAVVTIPVVLATAAFITWRTNAWLNESLQREILITLGIGTILLLILSWLTIRQALQPIYDLTKTATNIATGDLTRVAVVQSADEAGALARAFNSMTTQLRESITNLERRVADRTRDLERRAVQLQVAAQVANQAAAIQDQVQIMDQVVRLISEKFNFYHSGIFLLDETKKYAVLRAASSEGGQQMLARGHKLAVGQVGIVGYVAGKGEPRIALDVGSDAVFFNNPDLPQTRSELALPLKARGEIIGVLDVQSTKASAFTDEDVEILQILSDQIAMAIENARLLSRSQEIILELNSIYQAQVRQSWYRRLESHNFAYAFRHGAVQRVQQPIVVVEQAAGNTHLLKLPILLRNQLLGWIALHRNPGARAWSQEEREFAQEIVNQLALALENARLLEENRRRAQQEELLGNVSVKTQGLLDVESVIKTAVEEIGKSMGLARVQITLGDQERVKETG